MITTSEDNKKKQILNRVVTQMGGTVEEFIQERRSYLVNLAGKEILLEHHIAITRDPYIGVISTKCKDVTAQLLTEAKLPTPGYAGFYRKSFNKEVALKKLSKLKYPIIVKHAMGSNSSGLFVNIQNPKQAVKILRKELKNFSSMIAQEMVYGKEYRVLVLGNKVIAAMEMVHPYVVGDGESRLRNLINIKQNSADRRTTFDKQFKQFVKKQGFSLRDVVPNGKTVFIKQSCSLAEGGETRDVTATVHKDVVDVCVEASKVVGKNLVGIDIICKDISKKQTKKSLNILEVNGKPDFYIHYNPNQGKPQNVLKKILNFMVK